MLFWNTGAAGAEDGFSRGSVSCKTYSFRRRKQHINTNRRRSQHIVASSVCVLAIAASVGPGELAYCAGLLAQPFCRRRAFLAVSVFSSRLHLHPRDHTLSPPTIVVVDSSSSSVGPLSWRSRRFIGPVVLVLR